MKPETRNILDGVAIAYCNLFLRPMYIATNPQAFRLSGYNVLSQEAFKWPSFKESFLATSLKAQYVKSHVLSEWHAWDEANILAKLDDMKEDLLVFVSVTMPGKVIALTTSVIKQINEVEIIVREDFEEKGWCSCQIS
jgi:hypothetical protein